MPGGTVGKHPRYGHGDRNLVEAVHPGDFFDQIDLALNIHPERRDGDV